MSGRTARAIPPRPVTASSPPATAVPRARVGFAVSQAVVRAIAAARARSAAARAAALGRMAAHESHPAARTPQTPQPNAPTTATIRTGLWDTRSAIAVSAAAVTSTTAVTVSTPAFIANDQRRKGS